MPSGKELRLLAYFVEIASAGSIKGAARRLRLSSAVVSEALSDLEEVVGTTLVQRTTRYLKLTKAGQDVVQFAAEAIRQADLALAVHQKNIKDLKGILKITLAAELSHIWLPQIIKDFERQHPDIYLEVHADDMMLPLKAGEYEVAIRTQFSLSPRLRVNDLQIIPVELVCAPEHRCVSPDNIVTIMRHVFMLGRSNAGGQDSIIQAVRKDDQTGAIQAIPVKRRFKIQSQLVAHQLALKGMGAALLMRPSIEEDLEQQRLVLIDEDYFYGGVTLRAVARDSLPSAVAQAFLDFIAQRESQREQDSMAKNG